MGGGMAKADGRTRAAEGHSQASFDHARPSCVAARTCPVEVAVAAVVTNAVAEGRTDDRRATAVEAGHRSHRDPDRHVRNRNATEEAADSAPRASPVHDASHRRCLSSEGLRDASESSFRLASAVLDVPVRHVSVQDSDWPRDRVRILKAAVVAERVPEIERGLDRLCR